MITIKGLEFQYPNGEFNLNIPDFSVTRGSKVAVIGPSGSGKTTLLNLVSGMVDPTAGKVLVEGRDVTKLKDSEIDFEFKKRISRQVKDLLEDVQDFS